jgi:uncharacterized protein (DUF1810 family)
MRADATRLDRFVTAQQAVYSDVLSELQSGQKLTHWMWFIFPQLRGLGRSETAHFYGLSDRTEARAYAEHPVLGHRLRDCTRAILNHSPKRSAHAIFGTPDDLKVHSCMTLFAIVQPEEPLWIEALNAFFNGAHDPRTSAMLAAFPAG